MSVVAQPTERAAEPDREPRLRPASARDAAQVWRLVRDSGVLDLSSPYSYLLFLEHFGSVCRIAERSGDNLHSAEESGPEGSEIVGFVTAFHPPARPEVILVWQVGVAAAMRGRGLAGRLLDAVADAAVARGAHTLETTITPSNRPSQALFRSFARRRGARCEVLAGFGSELFPAEAAHESEELYRIGPLEGMSSERKRS